MSRFLCHSPMRSRSTPNPMPSINNPKTIFFNNISFHARQVATVGIAAMVALVVVSCTTTGDGYIINQEHPDRTATVEGVTNTIIGICIKQG